MKLLIDSWYKPSYLTWLLLPLSALYYLITQLRKTAYRIGLLSSSKPPVPVIIVGNISVGGTGKTPFVIWLLQQLTAAGYHPGVISRGYGGKSDHYPLNVSDESSPAVVGDEPFLIQQATQSPVVVDPKRARGAAYLHNTFGCDVIISDDGLQHYALARDIEIAMVDGERLFGNRFCLPAGPLREPVTRLNDVNFTIINGQNTSSEYNMQLDLSCCINLVTQENKPLSDFVNDRVHAIAGIGNPVRFFKGLSANNIETICHEFPDHHPYVREDLVFNDEYPILMTDKDAVKCMAFATQKMWRVPVTASLTSTFFDHLLEQLKSDNNG